MWNMIHCEVQGRAHIKANLPCQDKTCVLCDNGVHVIALADGAGSAKLSHYGAECITSEIANFLCKSFDEFYSSSDGVSVKHLIIAHILDKLNLKASDLNCKIKDLASTLLMAAVKEDKFILLHLGDGVIGYVKANEVKVASAPDNGEFANTTYFTTSSDAIAHIRIFKGELNDISGFILMSDGTGTALYNKKQNIITPNILKIMNICSLLQPKKVEQMLLNTLENVIKKITTDDCSIAILTMDHESIKNVNKSSYDEKHQISKIGINNRNWNFLLNKYDLLVRYLNKLHPIEKISKKFKVKRFSILKKLKHLPKLIIQKLFRKDV